MRNTTQVRYSVRESNSRWLALKLNMEVEERKNEGSRPESGSDELPPPPVAPLRGYPADSSARDIITERRFI